MNETRAQHRIDEALADLKLLLEQAVREEQLIDRLTRLGNDEALDAWIQHHLNQDLRFWLAFIEVDRFKSVNDEFGYDAADQLLRRIADQLRNGAINFFHSTATPFRAHGDEFFVGGPGDGTAVPDALEQIRTSIAALRVRPPDAPSGDVPPMKCTVSIGWATDQDAQASGKVVNVRELRGLLEAAVEEAKIERNRVIRFAPTHQKARMRSGRTDCGACHTRFDLRIPTADTRDLALKCPNCGAEVERPVGLRPAST